MDNNEKIELLRQAHEQGFVSDDDFSSRLAELTCESDDNINADSKLADIADKAKNLVTKVWESELVNDATDETKKLAKKALQSDMAADMATGAAGGAVIASVVPLVGTATGAVVGAALGAYKNFTKKNN